MLDPFVLFCLQSSNSDSHSYTATQAPSRRLLKLQLVAFDFSIIICCLCYLLHLSCSCLVLMILFGFVFAKFFAFLSAESIAFLVLHFNIFCNKYLSCMWIWRMSKLNQKPILSYVDTFCEFEICIYSF